MERFYSVKYREENIKENGLLAQILDFSQIPENAFGLPPQNVLIAKNFDILPTNEEFANEPIKIVSNSKIELWFQKDDKFKKPIGNFKAKLFTTDCNFGRNAESKMFLVFWEAL